MLELEPVLLRDLALLCLRMNFLVLAGRAIGSVGSTGMPPAPDAQKQLINMIPTSGAGYLDPAKATESRRTDF